MNIIEVIFINILDIFNVRSIKRIFRQFKFIRMSSISFMISIIIFSLMISLTHETTLIKYICKVESGERGTNFNLRIKTKWLIAGKHKHTLKYKHVISPLAKKLENTRAFRISLKINLLFFNTITK